MNTKFTKGPWISSDGDWSEKELVISSDARRNSVSICELDVHFDGDFGVEQKANAHLIACAPDMYKMLESKLDLIRCGIGANYSGDPKENPKYLEVVELLKRARGEHE